MARGYFLTERDREDLREILRAFRSGAFAQPSKNKSHREFAAIQEIAIGKTYDAIPADGSGLVDRWTVTDDAFAETSPLDQVTAYDWFGSGIPVDTKVVLVRLAHKEGTRWVAVTEGGGASTTVNVIKFSLTEAITIADETATASLDFVVTGEGPPGAFSVTNMAASSGYVFAGVTGAKGYAIQRESNGAWLILQMECG